MIMADYRRTSPPTFRPLEFASSSTPTAPMHGVRIVFLSAIASRSTCREQFFRVVIVILCRNWRLDENLEGYLDGM